MSYPKLFTYQKGTQELVSSITMYQELKKLVGREIHVYVHSIKIKAVLGFSEYDNKQLKYQHKTPLVTFYLAGDHIVGLGKFKVQEVEVIDLQSTPPLIYLGTKLLK